jgi:hypothetical protein
MNDFKITNALDGNIIQVEPKWRVEMKNGTIISGNRIKVRGLDPTENKQLVNERLKKLLVNTEKEVHFDSPEVIDTVNHTDAIVSCSVFLAGSNITYYFPEFIVKD